MVKRTSRSFNDFDKKELLKKLEAWRLVCVQVCTKAPIGGDVYRMADKLIGEIDTAAEILTGNRKFLLTPVTSIG